MDRVPFITAASFARRSSIPAIRLCGFVASCLLCVHSLSYIARPGHSMFRVLHNLADLVLFLLVGGSGIVAEVFPRDSPTHRMLKSNFPFFNSLIGRGFFYVVFGFIVMGNYTGGATAAATASNSSSHEIPMCRMLGSIFGSAGNNGGDEDDDSPVNFWGYFCVVSGVYMASVGFVLVYNSMKNQRSLFVPQQTEMATSPMVTPFIPSMIVTNIASPGYQAAPSAHGSPQRPTRQEPENNESSNFPIAV